MRKLTSAVEVKLGFDPGSVSVDGADAQSQFGADFACATAFANQLKHFQFAVRQLSDAELWLRTSGKRFQNSGRHLGAEINLSRHHLADGSEHLFRGFVLGDISTRSCS